MCLLELKKGFRCHRHLSSQAAALTSGASGCFLMIPDLKEHQEEIKNAEFIIIYNCRIKLSRQPQEQNIIL